MIRSFFSQSLVAGAALLAARPALADVKAGVDAWSHGDYAAAVREWKGPAEKGDSDAQFNLGQAYKLGRGVPQDLAKATELFAKASAQGHMQASDNYGLLLFQSGEHARAMPYINAAAERGDARAQYLLGLAYFNGENLPKDWVRGYALVSLAQQAGLAQAVPALSQMDAVIPLAQRRQAAALAPQIQAAADATRTRQLAAVDLGTSVPSAGAPRTASMGSPNFIDIPPRALPPLAGAGADYTLRKPPSPRIPPVAAIMDEPVKPAPTKPAAAKPPVARPIMPKPPAIKTASPKPAPPKPAPPAPVEAAAATPPAKPVPAAGGGAWRVQLGAFGVPGNADALWNRVKGRPELAGHGKLLVPAGKLQKLQAGGFASQGEAQAACSRLIAAGFPCIPARN